MKKLHTIAQICYALFEVSLPRTIASYPKPKYISLLLLKFKCSIPESHTVLFVTNSIKLLGLRY